MDNADNWQGPKPADLDDIRVRRDSPSVGNRDAFVELKARLCGELLAELDADFDLTDKALVRSFVHARLDVLLPEMNLVLNRAEKRQLMEAIVEELSGSGK